MYISFKTKSNNLDEVLLDNNVWAIYKININGNYKISVEYKTGGLCWYDELFYDNLKDRNNDYRRFKRILKDKNISFAFFNE